MDPTTLRALLSERTFDSLFEGHPDAIYIFDIDGKFIDANRVLFDRLGYTRVEMEDMPFGAVVDPKDRVRVLREFESVKAGETRQYVTTAHRKDGSALRVQITNIPLFSDGATVAVLGIARDIQELTRYREQAHDLDDRLSETLNAMTDGVFIVDRDWRFTYVNPRAEAIAGQSAADMVGAIVWDVFEGLDDSPFGAAYRKAMLNRETVVVRGSAAREGVWLEAIALPTSAGIEVIIHDISAEEGANQRLRVSEERNASQARLLDVATDAIIVRNLDHTIAYWNLSAARLYGWSPEEAVGSDIRQLIYEDLTDFEAAVQEALREGAWWGDLKQVTKSGRAVIVESRWSVVRDEAGKPITMFSVNTDVTENRSQRESIFRAQRMESLGTLASGIAHDLNNVLAPILMAAQLLAKDENDPARLQILRAVETGAKRGAELVRQVLAFARGADGRRDVLQVAALIDEVRTFLADTIDKSIRISAHVPRDLWPIVGDSTQLIQVLLNLAVNARDAMPDGGQLIFRAHNSKVDRPLLSVTHVAPPGKYVVVEVEDSGIGIDPSVLSKVFEPFFTTKEIGQGTGLGLATSVANVRGHGGFMQVYSEPGKGSKFLLYLPAALDGGQAAADEKSPDSEVLPSGSGELILIVDDEPAILELTSQTLEAFGYRTAIASNGAQAIEYVARTTGHVDLVLTDMMMPIMDGATTAATLLRRFPDIPIIGMSGLDANGALGRTKPLGLVNFLSKPYTSSELLNAVANALAGARGGSR